ncbi:hypothetical protein BU17DRAFT_94610 [Hysterangium stoloniferum]|nr:hypothetical protein BU17DRAFT_94610 [Hysterangium stoloniferum]
MPKAMIPKYHPKVTAIPFRISPRKAVARCEVIATMLTTPAPKSPWALGKKLLDLIKLEFAEKAKDVSESNVNVTQIQPIYFPTWRLHVNTLSDSSTYSSFIGRETFAISTGLEQYYPGHHMFPLSMLQLVQLQPGIFTIPKRWDDAMGNLSDYDGRSVICLPYTRSPFTFLEDFRTASKVVEGASIKPHVKFNMSLLPLYPILFPLYLIKFEAKSKVAEQGSPQLTVIVSADQSKVRAEAPTVPVVLSAIG